MARNWLDPKMADFKRQLFRKLSGAWYSLHLKPWTVLRKNQQEYYSDVYTIRKNHSKWCKENHMWWNFFSNKKEFHHLWYVLENTKNFSFFYSEVNKLTKNQGQANEYFSEERTQEKKRLYPKKRLFEHQFLNKRFIKFSDCVMISTWFFRHEKWFLFPNSCAYLY